MTIQKIALGALSILLTTGLGSAAADESSSSTQPSVSTAADGIAGQPSGPALDPKIAADVRDSVARQMFQRSDIKGGAFANIGFDEWSSDGVLIGFRLGIGTFFNNDVIKRVEPIYLTSRGEKIGHGFGDDEQVDRTVIAKAPPGYAVGAVAIGGGGGLDSVTLTFMRFNGTRLDPTDRCVTPRIGGNGGGQAQLDGDGTPIIGIRGRIDKNQNFLGLGVIFIKPTVMVVRTDQ
jgi:hypothetical protein